MKYWLSTFSRDTWGAFVAAGSEVARFAEKRWSTVERIQAGDVFVCYILGSKVFVGTLMATGPPKNDRTGKWSSSKYPIQVPVKSRRTLSLSEGVPIDSLKGDLSWFRELKTPSSWTYRLRNDPYEVRADDAKIILDAIEKAHGSINQVATPGHDNSSAHAKPTHDEIQWLLLSLGSSMGLNVRTANNDLNKSFEGNKFAAVRGLKQNLPIQFDHVSQRIIEHIDVLWLRGNTIVAAFEIEHTSAIYSGILRMSDLMAMQPNLNINLYIVAPDKRRSKVKSEINRPTFGKTRLPRLCRYISYSGLTQLFKSQGDFLSYMNPAVLDKIAEDMKK